MANNNGNGNIKVFGGALVFLSILAYAWGLIGNYIQPLEQRLEFVNTSITNTLIGIQEELKKTQNAAHKHEKIRGHPGIEDQIIGTQEDVETLKNKVLQNMIDIVKLQEYNKNKTKD